MQIQQTWVMPRQPIWAHKNQQFLKGVIKQIYKQIITCLLEDGETIKIKRQDIFHRNPMPTDINRNDLMENDIINEPEILQHLTQRFLNKKIYTYVENTLVAVNPYTLIPQLYANQLRDKYIMDIIDLSGRMKDLQPHLYAITAQMVKSLFSNLRNQAIIISGQSGAGKTQANKQCLRFLTHYFKRINSNTQHTESNIERTIILSNPILEAFGNAKTIRNNNSSRFGKYLSITIDSQSKIIKHAEIYNYLLEKSRIISRSKQEQNFHVFYEFLIKTNKAQKQKYFLIDPQTNKQLTFQDFSYTKNEGQAQYIAHPDVQFDKIKQSLTILPDPRSFDYLCRILSAVLHLGNLQPYQDDNLDYCEILPSGTFETVCNLLEIDKKYLFDSLTSYSIKIGGQDLVKSFSKRQVQQLIHSLSKTLYQRLFQWIINQINKSTHSQQPDTQSNLTLGFLDIYGFEVLKDNSLQQLFINYTNQRLHQIYLHQIFKLEKQQFVAEKLEHKFRQVNFEDNIKVIELIDYDNLSVFNLLDQFCAVASPDQSTFITKIRFNHKKHEKFPSNNLNLLSTQFMIRHTPQDILYNVTGFREKNKDLLREEIKITMRSSKLKALEDMFTQPKVETQGDPKAHRVRKFLSSKFRKQMNELVNGLLSKSQQHFIRCIKSNGNKKPLQIDQQIVYSQIKYLGILDTIKIKKMGYCFKIKYEDFDKRNSWLVRSNFFKPATIAQITAAIKNFLPRFGEEELLYGKTKIFFKDYAYTVFLKKYGKYYEILNHRAHQITSLFVKINYQRKKQRKIRRKKTVRKYIFGFLQRVRFLSRQKNIQKVQKAIREFLLYRTQRKKLDSIIIMQAYIKRNIESKLRLKKLNLIEKVVNRFKYLLFRKRIRTNIICNYIVQKVLMDRVWKQIRNKNIKVLSKYFNSLKVRIQKQDKILMASINERNVIEGKSLQAIQYYILGFVRYFSFKYYKNQIIKVQSNIKTFIARRKYEELRKKIILVQRAIKEYLFMKKDAKGLFQSTYKSYEENLKIYNTKIQQKLYDTKISHSIQTNSCIRKFLGKFKQKISLIYYIIDFQTFVDLELVYPYQSWINNYLPLFKEGLEKNDPLQYISVGETFTVAANTTKMYIWGMHDSFKHIDEVAVSQIKTKMPVEFFQINKNKLNFSYVRDDESEKKAQIKALKISSTVAKDYNLENGKVYECLPNQLILIKDIPQSERILQISCGKAHTILRSSSKKVYTFGYGRQGQLGHSSFSSEEKPRSIKYFENIKTFYPIQVVASFTSSLVLLSNRKLYWFGKNGTLSEVSTPILFQLKSKCQIMNGNDFSIGRVLSTWSRTMSLIGVTVLCYNGKFENNASLRNKTTEILFTKWQQSGINSINPPLIPAVSDHLEQCHVKLRNKKINIYPESKTTLKQMQQKVKSLVSFPGAAQNTANKNSMAGTEFSFANTQRNSIFK